MAVDPVPFVVHGAKHSADVFRQEHFDAMGGKHGISSVRALHTKQTGTPSNQVQVAPGGATILNSYSGGAGQAYSFRNASTTLVDVPASDSTGVKSWWVIAAIEDPQFGGQAPADPLAGPYAFLRCVPKSSSISYPHELLAEIVVPANTATITNAMITSLRKVAVPRRETEWRTYSLLAEDNGRLPTASADGQTWPTVVEDAWGEIFIPEWATRFKIRMMWSGVKSEGGNIWGSTWVQVGMNVNPNHITTQHVGYNTANVSDVFRSTIVSSAERSMPSALRGTWQKFYPRGNRNEGSTGSNVLMMDGISSVDMQIEFMERPDES